MEDQQTKSKVVLSAEQVRDKVVQGLKGSQWDVLLKYWWYDDGFLDVIRQLMQYTEEQKRWLPGARKMLRFLKETPYKEIKAVIITGEHSVYLDNNTGIPLSLDLVQRNGVKVFPKASLSIENMLESIGIPPEERSYDMRRYCHQGVLILSTVVTTRENGHHHGKLWQPTILRIIEKINALGNIPIIIQGEHAQQYCDYLTTSNIKTIKSYKWEDKLWWSWVNDIIVENGKEPIKWK